MQAVSPQLGESGKEGLVIDYSSGECRPDSELPTLDRYTSCDVCPYFLLTILCTVCCRV